MTPRVASLPTAEQTASVDTSDRGGIVAAATDYVESWLDGDADRMASCLHPELAKRAVLDHDAEGSGLDEDTFGSMTTAAVANPNTVGRRCDVAILAALDDIASAEVTSDPFVDLLHLARFGGRWLIVDALYEGRPAADGVGEGSSRGKEVLDAYASGWADRDVARARSVCHPAFVERRIAVPHDGLALEEATMTDMVAAAGSPADAPWTWETRILSDHGDVASGSVVVGTRDVYAHLARFGLRWLIVNVLYRVAREEA